MRAYEGAKYHGIFLRTPFELGGDMCGIGCEGYFGQFSDPVVFEVRQDAIFPALFSRIRVDVCAGAVLGAGRAVKRNALVCVGGKIDVPIGRGLTGNGAQVFLVFQRERVGEHRAETETAAKDAGRVHGQLVLEQCQQVGEENMILVITPPPRHLVGVSLRRHENDGNIIPFRTGLKPVKFFFHHGVHASAHIMHGKNQPVGFVLVVIGGNINDVLAGKTGAYHRVCVDAGFEVHQLLAATGAGDGSILQFMRGING